MDKFFQNRQGAYLMMIFGVAIAPLAEEMLFRGFLYPVLDRWLQTLFMTPRQLRRGCIWVLIMAAWGYLEHRLPLAWSVVLAAVAFLAAGGSVGGAKFEARESGRRVCGCCRPPPLVAWGLAARSVWQSCLRNRDDSACWSWPFCWEGSAWRRVPDTSVAGRWGRFLAVLVTSVAFAMVHSEQLGQAWGPLLVLFVVGLVLTITRVITRSVTPGLPDSRGLQSHALSACFISGRTTSAIWSA